MFVAMAGLLIASICIPQAFGDLAVEFVIAYAVVRAAHIALFVLASRDDRDLRHSVGTLTVSTTIGVGLLLAGALLGGTGQAVIWVFALTLDVGGPYFFGAAGWKLVPGHFAERHGLIIIIALGESIVAIGVGVAKLPISWPIVIASGFGLILASAMWWAYFDVSALLGEHALANEPAETRPRLGRNAFSFAHYPLVVGIVLVALGLKKVLEYVGDTGHHTLTDPLHGVPLAALVGGLIVYLLAHVVFKRLTAHTWSHFRLATAGALVLAWPVLGKVPAMGQLAVVAALMLACLVVESVVHAEDRRKIRAELAHH
jgi:low temperature requirement protein LtrA